MTRLSGAIATGLEWIAYPYVVKTCDQGCTASTVFKPASNSAGLSPLSLPPPSLATPPPSHRIAARDAVILLFLHSFLRQIEYRRACLVSYRVVGVSAGEAFAPCVVCVHDFGASSLSFMRLGKLLSNERGCRVLLLDLFGFGGSQPPKGLASR